MHGFILGCSDPRVVFSLGIHVRGGKTNKPFHRVDFSSTGAGSIILYYTLFWVLLEKCNFCFKTNVLTLSFYVNSVAEF